MLRPLLCFFVSHAPLVTGADPNGNETPALASAGAEAQTETEDAYAEQAALDVETLLVDSSRPYLEARARLVAHPALAAEALLDRLAIVPAPGPAERKRLLDVLAALARPEHVPLFAGELRTAILTAAGPKATSDAVERWRPLLLAQGAAAEPAIAQLVGDRELPLFVRALLLGDLVALTPSERVHELVALVGRGDKSLTEALHRALGQRLRNDAEARTTVIVRIDEAIERSAAEAPDPAEQKRLPLLLDLRARLSGGRDPAFTDRLVALASDDAVPFAVRVGAVHGLGAMQDEAAPTGLEAIARTSLNPPHRGTQRGEILGALALAQLTPERATVIVAALALENDDAPRLATLGYRLAPLPGGEAWLAWLDRGLENPWPTVRQAALHRVQGPCDRPAIDRLVRQGGPTGHGGDADRRVARAAIQALGRCGGDEAFAALGKLLDEDEADVELRAEAARQLTKRGGPAGVDRVARALTQEPEHGLARRFASALKYAPRGTTRATRALCERVAERNEVTRAAIESLRALHPDGQNPCAEPES